MGHSSVDIHKGRVDLLRAKYLINAISNHVSKTKKTTVADAFAGGQVSVAIVPFY